MHHSRDLTSIHENCDAVVSQLIQDWHIEQVFNEQEVREKIASYLIKHKQEILDFLWEDGKILIPMNSAKKFADIVIQALEIERDRVTEFKVSTYEKGVSMKQLLKNEDKDDLTQKMDIKQWDKVFILEDLIDTGHTLRILYDFLNNHMVDVKALCLLDKHVTEWDKVKKEMWDRLKSIIDIGQEFVIGFGMDYDERLCAGMEWLWKIKKASIEIVAEALNVYTQQIRDILEKPSTV